MKQALRVKDGVAAVEKALGDPALRSLELDFADVTDAKVVSYAAMQFWLARLPWSDLEELAGTNARSGDDVAVGFATAGLPSTLRSLAIRASGLRTVGVMHLAPGLPSALTALDFRDNALDGDAIAALFPKLPKTVASLDLSGNAIGDAGAAALVSAKVSDALAKIDLSRNGITPAAAAPLTARFGARLVL